MNLDQLNWALIVLCVTFLTLYLSRIVKEKRQKSILQGMDVSEFADFLRTNSIDGTIQAVAGKVSDHLKNSFGCEFIVFLRKKRGQLELSYYYGIRQFQRSDYRVPFSKGLGDVLRSDFTPRHISLLDEFLPRHLYKKLTERGMDTFFPIFWRDNLYGVYFIKSTHRTRTAEFNVLVASLAQSLSAAYHIKWHENKNISLKKQIDEFSESTNAKNQQPQADSGNRILKLVKYRKPETIIPRILDTVKQDLETNRLAYFYCVQGDDADNVQTESRGVSNVGSFDRKGFEAVRSIVDAREIFTLDEVVAKDDDLKAWATSQKIAGMTHVTQFDLSDQRTGVLAFERGRNIGSAPARLKQLRILASELVGNAEAHELAEQMSYTDEMTGLANHRYFSRRLDEEISRSRRYGRNLALIFFDLDELKDINDQHGHLAGDEVLRQMGQILRKSIRAIDIVARYGGDEFCIIMPESDAETCSKFMLRLQQQISTNAFKIPGVDSALKCTVSLGGSIFPDHADSPRELTQLADMALLKAKESGRNTALLHS